MSGFLRGSGPTAKLAWTVLVFLASFSLYGLYCYNTVKEVRVNGPFYRSIAEGKDLIADILPPPAYLIETYLTVFQLLDDKEGGQRPELVAKTARLKADYLARLAFWKRTLPAGDLRTALVGSYTPGLRMLETVDREFIPALEAGDRPRAEAVLRDKIQKDYADHRLYIDKVVGMGVKKYHEDEAGADIAVRSRTLGQIVLGLLLITLLSLFSWYLVRPGGAALAATTRA